MVWFLKSRNQRGGYSENSSISILGWGVTLAYTNRFEFTLLSVVKWGIGHADALRIENKIDCWCIYSGRDKDVMTGCVVNLEQTVLKWTFQIVFVYDFWLGVCLKINDQVSVLKSTTGFLPLARLADLFPGESEHGSTLEPFWKREASHIGEFRTTLEFSLYFWAILIVWDDFFF